MAYRSDARVDAGYVADANYELHVVYEPHAGDAGYEFRVGYECYKYFEFHLFYGSDVNYCFHVHQSYVSYDLSTDFRDASHGR